jgi:hypothetical protein
LKWEFTNAPDDDWGLNESRGSACEFVAWQFLCHLDQHETIEFLLEELPIPRRGSTISTEAEREPSDFVTPRDMETTPLLSGSSTALYRLGLGKPPQSTDTGGQSISVDAHNLSRYFRFFGLNALEIAAIAQAKRFLSQRVVQRVVDDIWNGEIVFWDSLTVHSKKNPHVFNRR